MRFLILFSILAFSITTCNNLEDASPSQRNTFVKFFEGPYSITASEVEVIPTGYVILGNMTVILSDTVFTEAVLIETDEKGNRVGEIHPFPGATGKAFKYIDNGSFLGYVIVGDSIYIDPQAEQAANVTVSSMRILAVNNSFENSRYKYISDTRPLSPNQVKKDFFSEAINLTDNGVIILGTFKDGVINQLAAPAQQLLFGLTNSLDSAWYKTYPLLGNTYINSKSIHSSNGKIIWASAIADVQGNFNFSYVTIPFVKERSEHLSSIPFGQTTLQLFVPTDIQPAHSAASGYGVVGTYSTFTDGSKGNMFFLRVDTNGKIFPGSDRYFDGIESFAEFTNIDKASSSIIDTGETLTSTRDGGFVLAGTLTTNPTKGKGGKDLFFVKVNRIGDVVWMKTTGGSGDEIPASIVETDNGDLVVCGTNKIGGFASVFLMKMDKNGELKN